VLHVAMNWRYDLGTASELGMQTAFVGRRGAKLPEGSKVDHSVQTLAELADKLLG
jgi:FMN phosphatase YigB (HAD superfamily)